MKQEDVPKVNSINISPDDVGELDWMSTIRYLLSKSDNSVYLPAKHHDGLGALMKFQVGAFIYEN